MLFAIDDTQSFELIIELPETKKNYVKIIVEDVPIGKLKTKSLDKRDDRFHKLVEYVPRYEISGNNINFSFHENKFGVRLGRLPIPVELSDVVEQEPIENLFEKDMIDKVSMDVNYLLGFILSLLSEKFEKLKILGNMRLTKKNGVETSFSKIINSDNLKKISENVLITGLVIRNNQKENDWRYYIREGEGSLNVTSWFEFDFNGTIDLYEIIERYMVILNDILLKI